MNLKDCHNFSDFRKLAQKKLPSPIFHYIDGAADDEITMRETPAPLLTYSITKIIPLRRRKGCRKSSKKI